MSILSDIFNAGTGGVITGLIGTIATNITNYKMKKLDNQHKLNMVKAETDAMVAEAEANIKITETKIRGELEISENQIYQETIKQAGQKSVSNELLQKLFDSKWTWWLGSLIILLLAIVDWLKAFIRPGLTIYLIILTTWITYTAYTILCIHDEALTVEQSLSLFDQVVNIIIYLTVSCVTWWFGDRRTAKFLSKMK